MSRRDPSRDKEQSRSQRSSNDDKRNLSPKKSLFSEHSINLPEFFSENLLYLEMEIETNNVTIEIVNQLLELYRIAIEYFESIKSDKFLIFKNRTQALLMRQTVNQCMHIAYEERMVEEQNKKIHHSTYDQKPPVCAKPQRQKELEIQIKYMKEQDQDHQVTQLIETHGQESQRITRQLNYFIRIRRLCQIETPKKENAISQIERVKRLMLIFHIYMKSILFSEEELAKLDPHPQEYVDIKTKYLNQLSETQFVNIKCQLPFLSLSKQLHQKLADQARTIQYEDNKMLDPNKFSSIFDNEPIQQTSSLKEQYYKEFIQKPIEEEIEQKREKENKYIQLCGVVNAKQKLEKQERKVQEIELEQLRREINQIQKQTKRVYYNEKEMCRNTKLIGRISGSLLSMYNIYFAEICDLLIDDILLDEMAYLNQQEQEKDESMHSDLKCESNEDVQDMLHKLAMMMEDV